MRALTERTIIVTVFDAICVDRKDRSAVRVPLQIAGYYDKQAALIEAVTAKSLLNPRLEIHRAINIRYLAEYRSMTDRYFQRHATLKDYFYDEERKHQK